MVKPDALLLTVVVPTDPHTAFNAFTSEMDRWWLRGEHSWNDPSRAVGIQLEPRVGGRWMEVWDSTTGEGFEVGRVLVWQPGERVVMTHRTLRLMEPVTEIEVKFEAVSGGTRVTLRHYGFEALPAGAPRTELEGQMLGWSVMFDWYKSYVWKGKGGQMDANATRPTDLFCIKRYDDAPRAIDWLEQAFGFEREMVVPGPDGTIAFAVLRFGNDFIGTGTARPGLRDAIAVYLEDPDAHFQRAKAAGVEITQEVEDTDFGARIYGCKDLDGHNWSFGTGLHDKPPGCDIFPIVGYKDPVQAIAWLKNAFGIEERLIVPGPDGTIAHAELGIGFGVIMPTSSTGEGDNPWAKIDFGLCAYVEDPDAHYARAKAAGAEIVQEIETQDYGARSYSVRDIEGTLWNFGDYRPDGSRP